MFTDKSLCVAQTQGMETGVPVMKRLITTLILAPISLAAAPYDGVYKQSANAECDLIGADGGSLQIKDGIFYGVDVECRMSKPVNVVDMDATLFTMQCSGEDQFWTERAMVMNAAEDDGIVMVWNGYAFRYKRCGDPEAAAATE